MSSREYALACHDILAMIFDHLCPTNSYGRNKPGDSRQDRRKTLASAALTCTTLSHHALNVLWSDLDSIHPLLGTLPTCIRVDSHLTLSGAISDESWSRFQLYAGRVRTISGMLDPDSMDPIHPSVWIFLAAKSKGSPLIPRLRSLVALDVRLSDTSALILLMSPSLLALDIYFALQKDQEDRNFSPHVLNSLMETLPFMAPNLETISYDVDIDIHHGHIKAFRHFVRLRTLSINFVALDEGALWELSTIATLQFFLCSIDLSNSSAITLPPQGFQSLLTLHVAGFFDDLTAFINACKLTSLTHLSLLIGLPPMVRNPTDLFVAVSRRCDRTVFTSFHAVIDYKFSSESPPPNCLTQHFEPLLTFPNIELFYLSFPRAPPSIRDDDLARFGAAWPKMTTFRVVHNRVDLRPSQYPLVRPTLSGLVDLARRCPRLEAFRVPILDATVVPDETAVLPLGHGLRDIFLHDIVLPATGTLAYTNAAAVFNRVFLSVNLEEAQKMVWPHGKEWKKFLEVLVGMRKLGGAEGGDQ